MPYCQINEDIIAHLRSLVGNTNILTDAESLENYAHDETPIYQAMPEVVVKPGSTDEVSKIMHLAHSCTIPVTPRSGGTSLSAGAVPIHRGIVMSFERMNRVKEIDTRNLMVIVEPGIITEVLGKELAVHGLFFPPDPVSLDSCMIGGNIAECAGGPRAMKYGVTKNYVTGIEVVLPNGTIQRYGGKLLKNVTGYDMISLIVGSEGTLALITEATLRVLPMPQVIVDLLIPFNCTLDAVNFAIEVLQKGMMPAAIELMEGDAYRMVEHYLQRTLPFSKANAHIIVEIDGNDKNELRASYEKIGDTALQYRALDVLVGESDKDKERIWEPRKKASEALKTEAIPIAREDLVVPKDKIPELITRLKSLAKVYGAQIYAFGHLGDGNIHADVAVEKGKDISKEDIRTLREKIYQTTVALGGTITAEHGIGLSKIDFLHMALDESQIEIMKQIKRIFDPTNILNPGKMFPA